MNAMKILLVEDDPSLSRIYGMFFEAKRFDVIMAKDGLEGLNMARTEKPDVIILDIMLPKMDGYKVCRILKSDPRLKETPIILHTVRMGEKDRIMAKETGADAFVVKGNKDSRDELVAAIEKLTSARNEGMSK